MKIVNEKPPIWRSIKALLDFKEQGTIFTYGDTIYNPSGIVVTKDLQAHESVHEAQQKKMNVLGKLGPARWWKKYLHNDEFRFQEELEAYRAQYRYAKGNIKGREQLHNYLLSMARHLTGPMYGNMKCDLMKAYRLISQ